jgi:hypothetical protein
MRKVIRGRASAQRGNLRRRRSQRGGKRNLQQVRPRVELVSAQRDVQGVVAGGTVRLVDAPARHVQNVAGFQHRLKDRFADLILFKVW